MDGVAESREPQGTHRMRELRLIDDADGPAVGLDPRAAHPLTVDQHCDSQRSGRTSQRHGTMLPNLASAPHPSLGPRASRPPLDEERAKRPRSQEGWGLVWEPMNRS